jgi:mannose-6-phosphate isomerase-like protein (cupin superfamily)
MLQLAPAKGKRNLEPLKSFAAEHKLPFNLLEDAEVLDNKAEVHMEEGDLWLGLEGETTFIVGGELVEPIFSKRADGSENKNEIRAAQIKGGEKVILRPGDWIWIPPGEPHQHFCEKVSRLAIIKIPKR